MNVRDASGHYRWLKFSLKFSVRIILWKASFSLIDFLEGSVFDLVIFILALKITYCVRRKVIGFAGFLSP